MSAPPEVLEIIRQWVAKAEHDLEAAKRIMAVVEGCPFDAACFHCQQATEKYLKALLTLLGIQAPRTHDLEVLAKLLPSDKCLSVPLGSMVALNPYAVDVRYADDWRALPREEAVQAFSIAESVREEVRRILPAEVLS